VSREQEAFLDFLERLECPSEAALVLTSADARAWDATAMSGFAATGLLVAGPPATVVTCPACEDAHAVDVEVAGGIEATPYIFCRSEGVVRLRADDLATWRLRATGLAKSLHAQLRLDGMVRERERGRAWALGRGRIREYVDVWLVRGVTWPDANDLLAGLRLPTNAWVFTTGRAGVGVADGRLLPLADHLSWGPQGPVLDLAQLATALGSSTQPAPPPYEFRCEGEFWHVRFENRSLPALKALKGLADIHFLLSRPDLPVPAVLLDGGTGVDQDGMEMADKKMVNALKTALADNSLDDTERARVRRHLNFVKGKAGIRTAGDPSDAARVRVAQRVSRALAALSLHDPGLADFLKAHIQKGHDLTYHPPPEPPNWVLV
jgi:hypothetical protein